MEMDAPRITNQPERPIKAETPANLVFSLLLLVLGAYAVSVQLERAVIALEIYRSHAFTPPPIEPNESKLHWCIANAQFNWDFSAIRVDRERRLMLLNHELKTQVSENARRKAAGVGLLANSEDLAELRGAPLAAQLDGEEWHPHGKVRIDVIPRAIRLIVP